MFNSEFIKIYIWRFFCTPFPCGDSPCVVYYNRPMGTGFTEDLRAGAKREGAGESGQHGQKGEGSRSPLETVARAATAIVVFGIPLVVGTATVLGYGAYSLYKRIRGRETGR